MPIPLEGRHGGPDAPDRRHEISATPAHRILDADPMRGEDGGMAPRSRPAVRWALPAGIVALVVGGSLAPAWSASAGAADLPDRTVEQLLTDLQTAEVDGLSGTLAHTADLGLPALPEGSPHSTDVTALLDGTHTLRVWYAGPHRARVALHSTLGELDIRTDGTDVWTWSSDDRTATHLTLPEGAGDTAGAERPDELPFTPEELTELVLQAIEPTTRLSTGAERTVAGRPVYELVVEPAAPGSLIGSIRIAVDAAEHVPTQVQVFPTGSDVAALDVGFTDLSFAVPDDDVFAFTPPEGATVEEVTPDGAAHQGLPEGLGTAPGTPGDLAALRPPGTVVGEGWASVVVARPGLAGLAALAAAGAAAGDDEDSAGLATLLESLPTVEGDWGSGRLLTSRLFSVLLTDDGRVLLGAVDAATLQSAAGDPAAALG